MKTSTEMLVDPATSPATPSARTRPLAGYLTQTSWATDAARCRAAAANGGCTSKPRVAWCTSWSSTHKRSTRPGARAATGPATSPAARTSPTRKCVRCLSWKQSEQASTPAKDQEDDCEFGCTDIGGIRSRVTELGWKVGHGVGLAYIVHST